MLDRNFWRAFGLFAGGVIGVGVFGLPKALVAAGVGPFLVLTVVVAVLAWWIQMSFLAVVSATPGKHRLPGYARLHLPPLGYRLAATANGLGLVGALIAYLIAGSTFLAALIAPLYSLSSFAALLLYVIPGAVLLLVGLRALPSLELVILAFFLLVLLLLPLPAADVFSGSQIPLLGEGGSLLLPYGILLFSFWGVSLIPETFELARRNRRRAQSVVAWGLVAAVVSYFAFAFLVAGITGTATTEDALAGLQARLGDGVVMLTLIFGVLTTFSSYLALGLTLARTLQLDFRLPRLPAWAVTVFVPLALVLLGVSSLLVVLALTGAVFLGMEGLAVLAMRWQLEQRRAGRWRTIVFAAGAALLLLGVVSELVRVLVLT